MEEVEPKMAHRRDAGRRKWDGKVHDDGVCRRCKKNSPLIYPASARRQKLSEDWIVHSGRQSGKWERQFLWKNRNKLEGQRIVNKVCLQIYRDYIIYWASDFCYCRDQRKRDFKWGDGCNFRTTL